MKRLRLLSTCTRATTVMVLLLIQVMLGSQVLALSDCHGTIIEDASTHAHHGTGASAAHTPQSHHDHHDATCECVPGMHCGQLAVVLPGLLDQSTAALPATALRRTTRASTSLAHREDPFRPPILRT